MKEEMIWLIWFEIKRNVFKDSRFGAAYGAGAGAMIEKKIKYLQKFLK